MMSCSCTEKLGHQTGSGSLMQQDGLFGHDPRLDHGGPMWEWHHAVDSQREWQSIPPSLQQSKGLQCELSPACVTLQSLPAPFACIVFTIRNLHGLRLGPRLSFPSASLGACTGD